MSDFNQALKWLKEGKKVRRKDFRSKNFYIYLDDVEDGLLESIKCSPPCSLLLWWIEETDWEIYEEEPKEKFPIKIKTKDGSVEIDNAGAIEIFDCIPKKENIICYCELEKFEEIIKKAKEVRDRK